MAEATIKPPRKPPMMARPLSPAWAGLGARDRAVAAIRARAVILFFICPPRLGSLLGTRLPAGLFNIRAAEFRGALNACRAGACRPAFIGRLGSRRRPRPRCRWRDRREPQARRG